MCYDMRVNNQPVEQAIIAEWQEVEFSCLPPEDGDYTTLTLTIEAVLHTFTPAPF